MSVANLDRQLSLLRECRLIKEKEAKELCQRAREIFDEEDNIVRVPSPSIICGDIHGQFFDLIELFRAGGQIPFYNYIFMGDYVDRGQYSVEVFLYLIALKVRYPNRITVLRGNHESRQITQVYGFYDECLRKYGSMNVWKYCTEVFDHLPLCCLVSDKVFCVHGGLSPNCSSFNQIQKLERRKEVPHDGGICDLLWSDPESQVEQWGLSPRGAGYLFGREVVQAFCQNNDVKLICRAHQLVMDGYRLQFSNALATVWSAPNYCYRCGNLAAILVLDENLGMKWITFEAAHPSMRGKSTQNSKPQYFL